jgi:hypothetical protein
MNRKQSDKLADRFYKWFSYTDGIYLGFCSGIWMGIDIYSKAGTYVLSCGEFLFLIFIITSLIYLSFKTIEIKNNEPEAE